VYLQGAPAGHQTLRYFTSVCNVVHVKIAEFQSISVIIIITVYKASYSINKKKEKKSYLR